MAGSITLSPDGVAVTTLVLDGTQANIDLATRKAAKKLNYTGDADVDLIDTVREFLVEFFGTTLDDEHTSQAKIEAQQAATADVASIALPNPPATTV